MLLLVCVAAFHFVAVTEAGNWPGLMRFQIGYARSGAATWLPIYRASLWKHDGGYVPADVQQFLCSRLENPQSQTETDAIVDFAIQQARGRELQPLIHLSTKAKTRFVDAAFRRLPTLDSPRQTQALYLVEEVRQGKIFGKGYFFVDEAEVFKRCWNDLTPETAAKRAMRSWWQLPLPATEKLRRDPLRGTGMRIDGY